MKHEKIFNRPDGAKIRVFVGLYIEYFKDEFKWSHGSQVCDPGKRKYRNSNLNTDQPEESEVLETKLELWEKLKPT